MLLDRLKGERIAQGQAIASSHWEITTPVPTGIWTIIQNGTTWIYFAFRPSEKAKKTYNSNIHANLIG